MAGRPTKHDATAGPVGLLAAIAEQARRDMDGQDMGGLVPATRLAMAAGAADWLKWAADELAPLAIDAPHRQPGQRHSRPS